MTTPGMGKTMRMANPDKELIVTAEALETCGVVSYWRASGDVSITALSDAWVKAGLNPKMIRSVPDSLSVLRRAVMQFQGRHRLVRGLKQRGEFAIVDEHVVEAKEGEPAVPPTYSTRVIVSGDSDNFLVGAVDADDAEKESMRRVIETACRTQAGLFDAGDITGWLVSLAKQFGAVTLRDSGGVYFIPRQNVDIWSRIANVVESVTNQRHRVFRIPAMKNTEAVAAITDAIAHEAEQVIAAMDEELSKTGDEALGKRALASRETEAAALLAKVESYEQLTEQRIAARERVEALQVRLAAASLAG